VTLPILRALPRNSLPNFNADFEPCLNNRNSNLPMVLVISCAHTMVHLTEQSFSSVEQIVCSEFDLTMEQSGKYGSLLRIPFGFNAFLTGILADRVDASRVLTLYLADS